MNASVTKYRKMLEQNLLCSKTSKTRLLDKFNTSLNIFLEDHPSPTFLELTGAFGPPEEMAAVLMENVTEAEKSRHFRTKRLLRVAAGVLAAAFIAFAMYIFFVKEYSNITIIESHSGSPASEWHGGE